MNPIDQQLAALFRDVSSDLSPDVTELVAGGIARGRRQRRRQGAGAALAAVAVIGVIGVAASVAPGLGDDSSAPPYAADPSKAPSESAEPKSGQRPDADITVKATDIPAEIATLLPPGQAGPALTQHPYPVVNEADARIVHFRWNGALTTFSIEPAAGLGSCQEMAGDTGACRDQGGVEVLTWGPSTGDGVTAQGVMVWQHGYAVSALSYNAPHGKEVAPIFAAPPISIEQLTGIASSEVWFSAS
ncbi:MAG: hypothetical protein M3237_14895 [Actinomycetota bacterium]|nr:hypothetical protein [Actinomycetota bacterium]